MEQLLWALIFVLIAWIMHILYARFSTFAENAVDLLGFVTTVTVLYGGVFTTGGAMERAQAGVQCVVVLSVLLFGGLSLLILTVDNVAKVRNCLTICWAKCSHKTGKAFRKRSGSIDIYKATNMNPLANETVHLDNSYKGQLYRAGQENFAVQEEIAKVRERRRAVMAQSSNISVRSIQKASFLSSMSDSGLDKTPQMREHQAVLGRIDEHMARLKSIIKRVPDSDQILAAVKTIARDRPVAVPAPEDPALVARIHAMAVYVVSNNISERTEKS